MRIVRCELPDNWWPLLLGLPWPGLVSSYPHSASLFCRRVESGLMQHSHAHSTRASVKLKFILAIICKIQWTTCELNWIQFDSIESRAKADEPIAIANATADANGPGRLWLRLAMSFVSLVGWLRGFSSLQFSSVQFSSWINARVPQCQRVKVGGRVKGRALTYTLSSITTLHWTWSKRCRCRCCCSWRRRRRRDVTWLRLMTLQNAFAFAFCFAFALALALLMCMVIVKFDYQCHSKYTRWWIEAATGCHSECALQKLRQQGTSTYCK